VFGAGGSLFAEIHHQCGGHKQQECTPEGDQVYSHNSTLSQADFYSAKLSAAPIYLWLAADQQPLNGF
jgi:hypothetical protein